MQNTQTHPVMDPGSAAFIAMSHTQAYQTQNYVNVTYDPIAWEHCRRLEAENNHHQNLLLRVELKENAFRDVYADQSGYMATGKSGKRDYFTRFIFTHAYLIRPGANCQVEPYYLLYFNSPGLGALAIPEKDFENDKRLLTALESHTHSSIRKTPTLSNSAALLRKQVAGLLQTIEVPFQAGWMQYGAELRFMQFADKFLSHQRGGMLLPLNFMPAVASKEAVSSRATELLATTLGKIKDPTLRGLLCLFVHLSFLYSLLLQLGYQVPLGLCLHCGSARAEEVCKGFFRFYEDFPIPLSLAEPVFARLLQERKDQAAVILDRWNSKSSSPNADLLEQAISSGGIAYKGCTGGTPLLALPVVLSTVTSQLSASPLLLTLDVRDDDFDWEADDLYEMVDTSEHFQAFAHFVGEHINDLKEALKAGRIWAMRNFEDLPSSGIDMLAALYGVWTILVQYFNQGHIGVDFLDLVPADVFPDNLPQLEEILLKEEGGDDSGEIFLEIVREKVASKELCIFEIQQHRVREEGDIYSGILYTDAEIFIPSKAVDQICGVLSFSRPMVVSSLKAAGLLRGRPINRTTWLTRITVTDLNSQTHKLKGLKIAREDFEIFGEYELIGG